MYEYQPSDNQREDQYTVHRLMEEHGPMDTMEMLGDYSITIHNDPEGDAWIGASSWEDVEPDHADNQTLPQFIWKFEQDGKVTFFKHDRGDGTYTGSKPANNVDTILVHVFNLVEQKRGNTGSDHPKLLVKYNQLMGKLIDRSLRPKPRGYRL